jgi:LacI family transcriptional regulator, galactose operon repressor
VVTVHDVARRAGVSIATVSRALNGRGRISEQTREHVLGVVRELGYLPNDLARGLVGMATQTIALLLPDITNPYFPELVKGVQTVADERGHLLLLCHNAGDERKAVADVEMLRRKKVDGLLLVAGALGRSHALAEATKGIPTVAMDRSVPCLPADLVTVDHRRGARLATEHLVELGHRHIAHLSGPPNVTSSRERRAGWRQAMRKAGLAPTLVEEGDFSEDSGYAAARRLLDSEADCTAVFAANDLSAIGLLRAFTEAGIRVPRDVSVVGFDGIHLTRYTTPRLTTVAQPIYELGRTAAELLLDRHDPQQEQRTVVLGTTLEVRESTAPPPQRRKGHR